MDLRHPRKLAKAFTLLEVALTLGVIVILISLMTGLNGSFRTESALRESANSISELVHDVRRKALLERTTVRLRIEADGIAVANAPARRGEDPERPSATTAVSFSDGVTLNVRDHDARKWVVPKKVEWNIGPDGTVGGEAIRLRIGKSHMDFEVNPVTGELLEAGFEL